MTSASSVLISSPARRAAAALWSKNGLLCRLRAPRCLIFMGKSGGVVTQCPGRGTRGLFPNPSDPQPRAGGQTHNTTWRGQPPREGRTHIETNKAHMSTNEKENGQLVARPDDNLSHAIEFCGSRHRLMSFRVITMGSQFLKRPGQNWDERHIAPIYQASPRRRSGARVVVGALRHMYLEQAGPINPQRNKNPQEIPSKARHSILSCDLHKSIVTL